MQNISLKFIRWGAGLTILGLLTGYFPLGHYLMLHSHTSCPAAPVHGHTILLSFVGMLLFGLVYRALPTWLGDKEPPLRLISLHFWCCVIGVLGVAINGTIGYELLGLMTPGFYYLEEHSLPIRNLWFGIDGAFLSVYGAGCVSFLVVLLKGTSYTTDDEPVAEAKQGA